MKQLQNLTLIFLTLSGLISFSGCSSNRSYVVLVTVTPPLVTETGTSTGHGSAVSIPPTSAPTPTYIPTPDPTRTSIVNPTENQIYFVQYGDTLGAIASWFGVSVEAIVAINNLPNENILSVGQQLIIPTAIEVIGPGFKIIPDSELVFGPALKDFDVAGFMSRFPDSFLAQYQEELNGRSWSGIEIVERVALEQSISPRLFLALLEYESQWLSLSEVPEDARFYPMQYYEYPGRIYNLYKQLDWAGKVLQTGYYGWRLRGLSTVILGDGSRVGLEPSINAGTAAVQVLLGQTRSYEDWTLASGVNGFFSTYVALFGDPFSYAVEPLIPPDLTQPAMQFPWDPAETWYYTGGPHGGWGSSSAWAALDFVPSDTVDIGCSVSPSYTTAVADGVIARSEYGIVVLDLDGDGFEGTGWTVFYLHLSSENRPVVEGQAVKAGDPIGHPACEGGVSYATHLHIARRYNGEWIPCDCSTCNATIPTPQLNLSGWLAYSFNSEYDGSLIKDEAYREACTCREPFNTFGPEDW
nr:LysM peptidoglycan-binding domain-containing protein [Anaerolineae bacterium]